MADVAGTIKNFLFGAGPVKKAAGDTTPTAPTDASYNTSDLAKRNDDYAKDRAAKSGAIARQKAIIAPKMGPQQKTVSPKAVAPKTY